MSKTDGADRDRGAGALVPDIERDSTTHSSLELVVHGPQLMPLLADRYRVLRRVGRHTQRTTA